MKIKGQEVMWKSEAGNVAVTYCAQDMGNKYKVYHKVKYDPNTPITRWAYAYAFGTLSEATKCAMKIPDDVVLR